MGARCRLYKGKAGEVVTGEAARDEIDGGGRGGGRVGGRFPAVNTGEREYEG